MHLTRFDHVGLLHLVRARATVRVKVSGLRLRLGLGLGLGLGLKLKLGLRLRQSLRRHLAGHAILILTTNYSPRWAWLPG
eukprot:scaffold24456_cov52-Phaeocystis_antarctica.AAC.2